VFPFIISQPTQSQHILGQPIPWAASTIISGPTINWPRNNFLPLLANHSQSNSFFSSDGTFLHFSIFIPKPAKSDAQTRPWANKTATNRIYWLPFHPTFAAQNAPNWVSGFVYSSKSLGNGKDKKRSSRFTHHHTAINLPKSSSHLLI
jgi:hypothetical protein